MLPRPRRSLRSRCQQRFVSSDRMTSSERRGSNNCHRSQLTILLSFRRSISIPSVDPLIAVTLTAMLSRVFAVDMWGDRLVRECDQGVSWVAEPQEAARYRYEDVKPVRPDHMKHVLVEKMSRRRKVR
jgi:hypothetical protein